MRSPAQLAVDVFAALEHKGAVGPWGGAQRCLCSPELLPALDAMEMHYTVTRGNGKGPRRAKVFHWEDCPTTRKVTQRVVEHVLGGIYTCWRGIGGWRDALVKVRPDVAVFDVESEVEPTLDGALAAHEAAAEHPALVVGLYSSREDLEHLAAGLPSCSKTLGPTALGPFLEDLTRTRANMVEVDIRATDYELLRQTAEVWAPRLGQEVEECGPRT